MNKIVKGVIVICSTCKKQEEVGTIKAIDAVALGFHICDDCYDAFLHDFGLENVIPSRGVKVNVAIPEVRPVKNS